MFNHKLGISLYALNTTYFDLLFLFENAGNEHVQSWRIHYIIGNIIDSSLHLKIKKISLIITCLRKCYSTPSYNYPEIQLNFHEFHILNTTSRYIIKKTRIIDGLKRERETSLT